MVVAAVGDDVVKGGLLCCSGCYWLWELIPVL